MIENTDADQWATQAMPMPRAAGQPSSTSSGSGRLEVRCPNCHSPMEVAADTALTDLTCSSCGSHFSLVDQGKVTRMAPPLSRMGRFELIERLGIGGFGSVWKARDKELDRTVAIKIPRQAVTSEEQEKFFREARAAAQLRHPNIVSVHEVGRDGDSVYIVSDFVRGVTLGDWLTGQQLTSREAAELCAKITEALHHAHEQGVVHRDLKPANIMIDPDGEPHLMDFGLARREIGEVTVTIDGQVLGTPAYMSPEQAQGEAHTADRRSDVYSLGVILFQLLTGELPFRGNARMIMHQVINDEPPNPRKLDANVSKDMETIVLKCLQKDPVRRYATAADLAADLRRYLASEPITARPVGALERRWRWCQRNPAVASLTAAAFGLLVIVAAVATIGYATTSTALKQKQEAATTAEQVSKFMADLFRSSDPIGWASGDNFQFTPSNQASANVTVRELIDRGAARIKTELRDQPEVQATLLETIGGVYRELGLFTKAAAIFQDAIRTREAIVPIDELKIATAEHNLGNALYMDGEFKEAEKYLRAALDVRRRLLGSKNLETSSTLQSLGLVLGTEGEFDEAIRLLDETVAIRRELLGDYSQGVAIALATQAAVFLIKGDADAATPCITEAVTVFDHKSGGSYAPEVLMKYQRAELALADQRYVEGAALLKETVDVAKKLLGPGHPYVAFVASEYANALANLGKFQAASEAAEEARKIWRNTVPAQHPFALLEGRLLSLMYAKLHRFDEASMLLDGVTADTRSAYGEDSFDYADCLATRSAILRDWGKTSDAVQTARTAFELGTRVRKPDSTFFLWAYRRELAECLLADQQPQQVFPLLTGSTVETGELTDANLSGYDKLESIELFGRTSAALGKNSDAERAYKLGETLATQGPKLRAGWAARFQVLQSELLIKKGDSDAAEKLLQPAFATLLETRGSDHDWTQQAAKALESLRAGRQATHGGASKLTTN